jgi:methionyl-tRNA formyltransferase
VKHQFGTTRRHERATVRAYDENGKQFERGGGGLLANIFEHEIDHLDGILFIDHATGVHDVRDMPAGPAYQAHEPFVFFGTPYVARDTLEFLVARGYRPSLVVTSPDAPKGRGLARSPSETKTWAEEHGFPVFAPETLDAGAVARIQEEGAEYALVVAYGKLLPQALIDAFPKGVLNVHYSLLPKYRGASPVEAALLSGETVTGVSVQQMVKKLDAGDIVAQVEAEIGPEETTRELRPRLIALGAELLAEALPYFETGRVEPVPQDESAATHAGKIAKEDGELRLAGDARGNWNRYRAYAESPGTYFYAEKSGKKLRVKIREASFADGRFAPVRVVPEGKKEMAYEDFLRGGYAPL